MLLVAHRLETIRDCDMIFVMKHGQLVEQGQHDGLMSLVGLYEHMVRTQVR